MSAIDQLFQQLRSQNQKAFMPFITAGDPDLEFTSAVMRELDKRGCHMCELGIPYSDPIADGPVIQASYTRALDHKIKVADIMQNQKSMSADLNFPVVSMVSYAIIFRHGLEKYVDNAIAAGFSGAIVPDLLVDEAASFSKICQDRDFSLIQLVTPTTPKDRAVRIANSSTGFLYYVSVTGITGERTELPPSVVDQVGWLREQTELPICIGFGISTPEHIKMLKPVADGMIVGSAIVKRVAEAAGENRDAVIKGIGDYVQELMQATNS